MRWQLAQNTLVVVSIALAFGKHIGRFKLDAIGIEQFRTLPNHTLVFARRTAGGGVSGHHTHGRLARFRGLLDGGFVDAHLTS